MKYWPPKSRASAGLLIFLCPFLYAISAHAQNDSASQLSTFQIFREYSLQFLALKGAALSPDGQQVAVAYFSHVDANPRGAVALRVQIWNVGTQEPVASKQLSVTVPNVPISVNDPGTDGFVQYCDHGAGIMVADSGRTLYYLNSQTLEVIHATATENPIPGTDPEHVPRRIYCAANSTRAVIAFGGAFLTWDYPNITYYGDGNGLVRLYDLTSGTFLKEWNTTEPHYDFGDVAISPSGNQIAVSHIPGIPRTIPKNSTSAPNPKDLKDVELFDVETGKMTLQVDTGRLHWPGRISFVGVNQIASDDTRMAQPLYPKPRIKLWDTSNGKLIKEFADPKVGARRFVGASSDGHVILGYIPKERLRSGRWNETLEERFRLWDAATGKMIATSPLFRPHPDSTSKRWNEPVDPSMELSDNGRAVIVYWKQGVFRIYVFSLPPAASPQPH